MTSLIHLNGPPGIGKSTMSALYAQRHPGTLNLDIDILHQLVEGWRGTDSHAHEILRPLALAMASTHLAGGRDVVLPQYLARLDEIAVFENVAHEQGADFCEIVLMHDKAESVARFGRRQDDSPWGQHNRQVVARLGGSAMLSAMYDRLSQTLRLRPSAVVIHSEPGEVESTYASLARAVLRSGTGSPTETI